MSTKNQLWNEEGISDWVNATYLQFKDPSEENQNRAQYYLREAILENIGYWSDFIYDR